MSTDVYSAAQPTTDNGVAVRADLRSDTVTRPTEAMRQAMFDAHLGDDVYGDDPTVNALEATAAERLGKEAALFVSSGTQSNLSALMAHCARGEEVLVGEDYHVFGHEARGASVLAGIALHPIQTHADGTLKLTDVESRIKPDDNHYPITRLLSLENTVSGAVQPQEHLQALVDMARAHGLATHLDGARVANASVASGMSLATAAAPFDSVSVCLSKGLGAPVGSVLCGPIDLVASARRIRKLLGGGTRQAGFLAAAGLYALENNLDRLADDHDNATRLAAGLASAGPLKVTNQTNMVFVTPPEGDQRRLAQHLAADGVVITPSAPTMRLVTHLDVSDDDVAHIVASVRRFYD